MNIQKAIVRNLVEHQVEKWFDQLHEAAKQPPESENWIDLFNTGVKLDLNKVCRQYLPAAEKPVRKMISNLLSYL